MNLLIVSATLLEVSPLLEYLNNTFVKQSEFEYQKGSLNIKLLITGVGQTATAFALGRMLAQIHVDLVLNLGIAGSYDDQLSIGEVVHVVREEFGDLGSEDQDGTLIDAFELGLMKKQQAPFVNGQLINIATEKANFLPHVNGVTLNKTHGSYESIQRHLLKFPDAQVESMEGAAVFYASLMSKVSFISIKAISNKVEARNKDNWDIPKAIESLNKVAIQMVNIMFQ